MSTRAKILISIGVILFVCLVVWVVRTTPTDVTIPDKIDPPKFMEYEGTTITEEKDGVKIWEMTSKRMRVDTETQKAELEDLVGKFYQDDGKFITIKGDKGAYNQQTKNIYVEGNVSVKDSEGSQLDSGKLFWFNDDEIIRATEDVKIAKDDMRAFADEAQADREFSHFTLKGHARVLKGVKEDEQ